MTLLPSQQHTPWSTTVRHTHVGVLTHDDDSPPAAVDRATPHPSSSRSTLTYKLPVPYIPRNLKQDPLTPKQRASALQFLDALCSRYNKDDGHGGDVSGAPSLTSTPTKDTGLGNDEVSHGVMDSAVAQKRASPRAAGLRV